MPGTPAVTQKRSLGELVTELLRQSLTSHSARPGKLRNGISLFPIRAGAKPVTPEIVDQLLNRHLPIYCNVSSGNSWTGG